MIPQNTRTFTNHQPNLEKAMDSFIFSLVELASSVAAVNTHYEDYNDIPNDEESHGNNGTGGCTIA